MKTMAELKQIVDCRIQDSKNVLNLLKTGMLRDKVEAELDLINSRYEEVLDSLDDESAAFVIRYSNSKTGE